MKNFTKKLFGLSVLMAFTFLTNAQTVIWGGTGDPNGEFAGGLNDWTVAAIGDPDALWVWEADGRADLGAYSGTQAIQSPSVANGAVVFDSDFYDNAGMQGNFGNGVAPAPQLGELISPIIDLTGQPSVSLKFNQYYRNFQSSCLVAWSNDGGSTWVDTFDINSTVLINAGTVANDVKVIPLLGGGGTAQFQFKFIFDANYYFWVIDDVSIIERPEFDLSLGDFFFSPASYAQPLSQITNDTMGFSVDVNNYGRVPQDDVMLKVEVFRGTTVVYTDEINIGTILPTTSFDSTQTYFFDDMFTPDMLTVGTYNLRYSVSSANTDSNNSNNTVQQEFRATTNFFSKDDQDDNFVGAVRPSASGDYFVGNLYTTSQNWVDNFQATRAVFSCAVNQDDPIADKAVNVYLLSIHDDILPGLDNFDDQNGDVTSHPDLDLLGFGNHVFVTYNNYDDVSVDLSDLDEGTLGIPLNPGTRYFLMAEYSGDASSIFHSFNTKIKYFQLSTLLVTDNWFTFGPEDAAVMRMFISLYSTSDEVSLPDNSLTFYPNPASTNLNVDINLEEPSLANITIADLNGRVIEIDEVENAFKQNRQYDVSGLANGTYIVRIATKAGTKTKKFVVQH